jgi:hypothetical protein
MSRTLTAPLDSSSYWRRLLATCLPDREGGAHDLFVLLSALREHVEECGREGLSSKVPRGHDLRSCVIRSARRRLAGGPRGPHDRPKTKPGGTGRGPAAH